MPFSIKVIQGQIYVQKSATSILPPGTKIVKINNVASTEIIKTLAQNLWADGYINTFRYRHLEDFSPTQSENYFDLYYSIWYGNLPTSLLGTIQNNKGQQVVRVVNSLDWNNYQNFYKSRNSYPPALEIKMLQPNSCLLVINSFHESYRQTTKQDFQLLFEQLFTSLEKNKAANLIIDVRRCEGGDNSFQWLLSYLMDRPFQIYEYIEANYSGLPTTARYFANTDNAFLIDSMLYRTSVGAYRLKPQYEGDIAGLKPIQPAANFFKGKIYVLTSGATGSAAAILCSILKAHDRAVFLGEETGGSMDGPTSLNFSTLVLPHTKLRVEIPHIKTKLAINAVHGRGVMPNYPIEITPQQLKNKFDPELNHVLQLTNQSR